MAVKITYFVHGTTTDNEQDLATGQAHGELSDLGKRQAKELGKQIAGKKFDIVFTSDLKRAVDSVNLMFGNKYKVVQDKRLRECDYGKLTEKPCSKFKSQMAEYIDKPFQGGESYKDVEKRISVFLSYLKDNYNNKHVAIVAHQAPQLALDVLIKGRTWKQAIDEDWRKRKAWQPGWEYALK